MLTINKFYWELFKQSPIGQNSLSLYKDLAQNMMNPREMIEKLFTDDYYLNVSKESEAERYEDLFNYLEGVWIDNNLGQYIVSKDSAKYLFSILENNYGWGYHDILGDIVPLSIFLYIKDPETYIPYLFSDYKYLVNVIDNYDLDLDGVPGRAGYDERCFYYLDICHEINKFKELNSMNGPELCSFLFCMEKSSYDSLDKKIVKPYPKVWLIGGSKKSEQEATSNRLSWQASADTKKGDIMIFYETGDTYFKENKSAITGIWIAQTDGIIDPLSYYYGEVIIGNEVKINPIPFSVLSKDDRTKKLPRLGAHFLGIRGDAVSTKLYEGLLSLIEERQVDFDRSVLPSLHVPYGAKVKYDDRGDMKPEKWVEEYLIKEMLEQMGWNRLNIDYCRQVHLQMGRAKLEGEKVQDGKTDFSLFPFGKRMKCADVLIEAKAPGEMDGNDIEKTFWQAESYASRQYSNLIILADGDKILLFPRKKDGTFSFSNTPDSYTWDDIFNNVDSFNSLRDKILRCKRHSTK